MTKVLKELGYFLLRQCRPYDTAVRSVRQEFLILLRGTQEQSAMVFAERIRAGVEAGFSREVSIGITLSIDLAINREDDTLETLSDSADQGSLLRQTERRKHHRFLEALDRQQEQKIYELHLGVRRRRLFRWL